MAEERSHKATANRIAKRLGTTYEGGKGVDVKSPRATVEVESPTTMANALTQLQGHRGKVYIAGTNMEAVQKAIDVTKGTTVGVMDNQGNIVKKSTRGG